MQAQPPSALGESRGQKPQGLDPAPLSFLHPPLTPPWHRPRGSSSQRPKNSPTDGSRSLVRSHPGPAVSPGAGRGRVVLAVDELPRLLAAALEAGEARAEDHGRDTRHPHDVPDHGHELPCVGGWGWHGSRGPGSGDERASLSPDDPVTEPPPGRHRRHLVRRLCRLARSDASRYRHAAETAQRTPGKTWVRPHWKRRGSETKTRRGFRQESVWGCSTRGHSRRGFIPLFLSLPRDGRRVAEDLGAAAHSPTALDLRSDIPHTGTAASKRAVIFPRPLVAPAPRG